MTGPAKSSQWIHPDREPYLQCPCSSLQADDKEVDLPLDGLIAALAEMGITSSAK